MLKPQRYRTKCFELVVLNAEYRNLKQHPNIVQYLGVCVEPSLALVMEYLEGGSLWELLQSSQQIPTKQLIEMAKGSAAGIFHLHEVMITLTVAKDSSGKNNS